MGIHNERVLQNNILNVKTAIENNENIIIFGNLGSGKTTLLTKSLDAIVKENMYGKQFIIEENFEFADKYKNNKDIIITKISADDLINISSPENTYIILDEFRNIDIVKIFLLGSSLGIKFILSDYGLNMNDILSKIEGTIINCSNPYYIKEHLLSNLKTIISKFQKLEDCIVIEVNRLPF